VSPLLDTRPLRTSPVYRRLWLGSSLSALGSQFTLVAALSPGPIPARWDRRPEAATELLARIRRA